jgi:hypothetical protein
MEYVNLHSCVNYNVNEKNFDVICEPVKKAEGEQQYTRTRAAYHNKCWGFFLSPNIIAENNLTWRMEKTNNRTMQFQQVF